SWGPFGQVGAFNEESSPKPESLRTGSGTRRRKVVRSRSPFGQVQSSEDESSPKSSQLEG
ncbi:hypothetical protein, partial [Peribacillus kribbensis]|uniref:hypothetical protein n=1 Tax=Peribacillus kribbensis TaxID=356658 RepID=UPI001C57096F